MLAAWLSAHAVSVATALAVLISLAVWRLASSSSASGGGDDEPTAPSLVKLPNGVDMYHLRKGETDLAVGNVVGSNIFNLLLVLGITSTVRPVPVPAGGLLDLLVTLGVSALLLVIAVWGRARITRGEGLFLLLVWAVYGTWRTLTSQA